jgi:hypothetical protein
MGVDTGAAAPDAKKAAEAAFLQTLVGLFLQGNYVFRLRAFLALGDGEVDLLAFSQSLETAALNSAVVNKNVCTAFTSNKAKAFSFVEELNGTGNCRHINLILNSIFLSAVGSSDGCRISDMRETKNWLDQKQDEALLT